MGKVGKRRRGEEEDIECKGIKDAYRKNIYL
jgi:hypothetical protein